MDKSVLSALLLPAAFVAATMAPITARADVTRVDNLSRSPFAYYGNCLARVSGIGTKRDLIKDAGLDPDRAQYIDVLDCHDVDGSGGTRVAPCPAGTSYTYCLRNFNDGSGNHVMLGVVEDTTAPICQLLSTRAAPIGQIDVLVRDEATGISHIEFRGGVDNALMQEYSSLAGKGDIVVTATKIDSGKAATLGSFIVRDRAGNFLTCGPYPF